MYDGGDVPILHGSLSLCLFITRCKRGGGWAGSGVQVSTHAKPSFPRRGTVAPKMPRQSPLVDASVPATEPRQQVVRAPRHPSHRGQGRHGCSRRRTCGGGPRRRPMRLAEPRQRQLQDRRRCTSRPRRRSDAMPRIVPSPRITPCDESWDCMHRPMETSVLGVCERSDILAVSEKAKCRNEDVSVDFGFER